MSFAEVAPALRKNQRSVPFLVHHLAGNKRNRIPVIRIPVTPANRALLRDLRAAEMTAWTRMLSPGARRCEIQWEEAQ